mgnify:CR=1 FL=1
MGSPEVRVLKGSEECHNEDGKCGGLGTDPTDDNESQARHKCPADHVEGVEIEGAWDVEALRGMMSLVDEAEEHVRAMECPMVEVADQLVGEDPEGDLDSDRESLRVDQADLPKLRVPKEREVGGHKEEEQERKDPAEPRSRHRG